MPRPVRIGINALYLIPGEVGGTEIYLRSLLRALASIDHRNEYFIYVNAETAGERVSFLETDLERDAPPHFHTIPCGVRARFRPQRILWEQTFFPSLLRKHRIDVVLNAGFTMPVVSGRPMVTVFHDLQHKRHPEFFRWFDLPFWNLLLWLSVVRSRSLIAVSAATARDLELFYPGASAKTVMVHHGVDPEFFRIAQRRAAAEVPSDPYVLIVSTLHPHKNLARVLEAFALFRKSHIEIRLVIAGLKGFASDQLESRRRELGLEAVVRFTGWIPRQELYELFEGATAFLAPSEFEGFGMPVIEALAAGIPTACSSIPPFDEIAGSAAARFDPGSVPAIAAAMDFITTGADFQARARIAGPEQARRFDWQETARLTLEALERAAGSASAG
jgi:glycosyltransferase involved in cell wall biosynthesis